MEEVNKPIETVDPAALKPGDEKWNHFQKRHATFHIKGRTGIKLMDYLHMVAIQLPVVIDQRTLKDKKPKIINHREQLYKVYMLGTSKLTCTGNVAGYVKMVMDAEAQRKIKQVVVENTNPVIEKLPVAPAPVPTVDIEPMLKKRLTAENLKAQITEKGSLYRKLHKFPVRKNPPKNPVVGQGYKTEAGEKMWWTGMVWAKVDTSDTRDVVVGTQETK